MTTDELLMMHKALCSQAEALMSRKNHDYSGKSGKEPFANFTRSEAMGITTTEKGILVRLLDKVSRLSTFTDAGIFKVEDEKLEDTILDMINYSILFYAYIQSKKEEGQGNLPFEFIHLEKKMTDVYDMYSKGSIVPNTEDTR
jgi:hypothetical protein